MKCNESPEEPELNLKFHSKESGYFSQHQRPVFRCELHLSADLTESETVQPSPAAPLCS